MDRLFMFTHFNECKCHSGHVNYGTATPPQLQTALSSLHRLLLPIYIKNTKEVAELCLAYGAIVAVTPYEFLLRYHSRKLQRCCILVAPLVIKTLKCRF